MTIKFIFPIFLMTLHHTLTYFRIFAYTPSIPTHLLKFGLGTEIKRKYCKKKKMVKLVRPTKFVKKNILI